MRFEEAYEGLRGGRLTQADAALLLGYANERSALYWGQIRPRRAGCANGSPTGPMRPGRE